MDIRAHLLKESSVYEIIDGVNYYLFSDGKEFFFWYLKGETPLWLSPVFKHKDIKTIHAFKSRYKEGTPISQCTIETLNNTIYSSTKKSPRVRKNPSDLKK